MFIAVLAVSLHWRDVGHEVCSAQALLKASGVHLHVGVCITGRAGPSFAESRGTEKEMLPVMLNHIIKTYFPDIWEDITAPPDQVCQLTSATFAS